MTSYITLECCKLPSAVNVVSQNLNPVEKVQHLRSYVIGEAEQSVKHFNITGGNYSAAWEFICEQFNNKNIMANAFMSSFVVL